MKYFRFSHCYARVATVISAALCSPAYAQVPAASLCDPFVRALTGDFCSGTAELRFSVNGTNERSEEAANSFFLTPFFIPTGPKKFQSRDQRSLRVSFLYAPTDWLRLNIAGGFDTMKLADSYRFVPFGFGPSVLGPPRWVVRPYSVTYNGSSDITAGAEITPWRYGDSRHGGSVSFSGTMNYQPSFANVRAYWRPEIQARFGHHISLNDAASVHSTVTARYGYNFLAERGYAAISARSLLFIESARFGIGPEIASQWQLDNAYLRKSNLRMGGRFAWQPFHSFDSKVLQAIQLHGGFLSRLNRDKFNRFFDYPNVTLWSTHHHHEYFASVRFAWTY